MQHPSDAIALRLVQQCYLSTGDALNSLSCIARVNAFCNTKHALYPQLNGMLALGYAENGKLADAEETACRVTEETRGANFWALNAYLNLLVVTGRCSEASDLSMKYLQKILYSPLNVSMPLLSFFTPMLRFPA